MLRHGLLSPNSKLLPASASLDSLASFSVDGHTTDRPGSMMSMVSNGELVSLVFSLVREVNERLWDTIMGGKEFGLHVQVIERLLFQPDPINQPCLVIYFMSL